MNARGRAAAVAPPCTSRLGIVDLRRLTFGHKGTRNKAQITAAIPRGPDGGIRGGILDELEFPGDSAVLLFADTCVEESHSVK